MPEVKKKEPATGRDRYHHGDLHQAILEAACLHLRTQNADSLSLRALAREIGVSQTAPYRHFDSKNALFAAVATWGFRILEGDLAQMSSNLTLSASQAMVELGMTYLRFAENHAEKYQLCFDSSLVEFDEYSELQAASAKCFDHLSALIRRGIQSGEFEQRAEEELAAIAWAGLHGLASLSRSSRPRDGIEESATLRAIDYLIKDQRGVVTSMLRAISVV
jgi:AcrR family transcriptional regulator